ncbi:hypothetical protein ACFSQD_14860 [Flavihumibacter stibioxidans]|uniref:SMP-30/Gluconolactonase/LRE-like region domain-containing protein n=1 Tax=Flavihumibacter stibioxidans TaxID=1834163 RepID=A0ABR7M7W2_9BACT|nr:hypothetical protein [Flavihumibacter stibioxidans]MBC6491116.1 hypothetical protein [Flavihumibacter stibioxidans]
MPGLSFVPAIPGYHNNPASTILLKKPLREISGISYHGYNKLAGINDEDGILFYIDTQTGQYTKTTFGEKGDYEDIVRTPAGYFVLESNGTLHQLDGISGKELAIFHHDFPKFTEFESLCYNARSNQLILICKTCGPNEPFIHAWSFDLTSNSFRNDPVFSIAFTDIRRLGKDDTIECQPSAAAFHPITNQLYIIASLGKVLIQCKPDGTPEAVYGINADLFQQPEGLCFAPNGDLFICNEGRQSKASLLYFPYQASDARRD